MSSEPLTTQPALVQLKRDFDTHIQELRGGIETSEELVFWLHRASVLTLGATPDETLTGLTQGHVAHAILLGRAATKPRREELETEYDSNMRQRVEDYIFNPIFRSAFRELSQTANEYVDGDETASMRPQAGRDDAPPALRPAIRALEEEQRDVLERTLQEAGMDSKSDLSDWMRDLVSATRGHISEDFLNGMSGTDRVLRGAALGTKFEEPVRHRFMQMVAAHKLLPAFNSAIRDLSQISTEKTPEDKDVGMPEALGA